MSFEILIWKLKKWFTRVFRPGIRYTVGHTVNEDRVFVYVFDSEKSERMETIYGSYNYATPRWWTRDMYDSSFMYIFAPNNAEKAQGITFENKIEDAYAKLQIIADALNKEVADKKERELNAKEVAQQAAKDAKNVSKKFSSKKM